MIAIIEGWAGMSTLRVCTHAGVGLVHLLGAVDRGSWQLSVPRYNTAKHQRV